MTDGQIHPQQVYDRVGLVVWLCVTGIVTLYVLVAATAAVFAMQVKKLRLHRRMDARMTQTLVRMDEVMAATVGVIAAYKNLAASHEIQAARTANKVVEKVSEKVEKTVTEGIQTVTAKIDQAAQPGSGRYPSPPPSP